MVLSQLIALNMVASISTFSSPPAPIGNVKHKLVEPSENYLSIVVGDRDAPIGCWHDYTPGDETFEPIAGIYYVEHDNDLISDPFNEAARLLKLEDGNVFCASIGFPTQGIPIRMDQLDEETRSFLKKDMELPFSNTRPLFEQGIMRDTYDRFEHYLK